MKVFNDLSSATVKKEHHFTHNTITGKTFSDEDIFSHHQDFFHSSDDQPCRKAKSLETERLNINKKYRLDKQKITKEFTQDFLLEEYKEVPKRDEEKRKNLISKKYESDANNTSDSNERGRRNNSSDGGEAVNT